MDYRARNNYECTCPLLRSGALLLSLLAGVALLLASPSSVRADKVLLKTKKVIEGIIDKERTDDTRVYIRTINGTVTVLRSNIERIEGSENANPNEVKADLAAQDGDLDTALEFYLRAYAVDNNNESLGKKVADMKARIKERDEKKFEVDFKKIDGALNERDIPTAMSLAQALASRSGDESSRKRRQEKLAEVYLFQARDLRNRVDFSKAEQSYREAIKANPSNAGAQFELAEMVANYPTRKDEAFALYKTGIDLVSSDPTLISKKDLIKYRNSWAELQVKSRNYREAAASFWFVAQGDKDEAYPRAIDSALDAYQAISAELIAKTQANDQAIATLKAVIEKRPLESKARYLLGKIYYERQEYEAAVPLFEQALKNMAGLPFSSELSDLRYSLGICYRKTRQDAKAVAQFSDVLRDQPSRYEVICELGEVYLGLNDLPNALAQAQTGVRVEPTNYRAFLLSGRTLKVMKRYEDALKQYKRLFELRDESPDYLYEMGLIYMAMDRLDDARDTFLKVIQSMPKAKEKGQKIETGLDKVYVQLGLVTVKKGGNNEAIEYFDKSLAINAALPEALDGKGQAYRALKDLDKAEQFFTQAIKADPNNPSFLLDLGVLYHKDKQDTQTALKYYLAYYQKGGTDPQVRTWIAECGGTPPDAS